MAEEKNDAVTKIESMDPCCGCMSVKTGSLVCGLVELVLVTFNFVYTLLLLLTVAFLPYVDHQHNKWANQIGWRIVQGFLGTVLLLNIVHGVIVVLFILGIRRERADFVAAYLISALIFVVVYLIVMIGSGSFLLLIIAGLKIYFMCVAAAFYLTIQPTLSTTA